MTVIIVPEMPISRLRASSAVPWKSSASTHESRGMWMAVSTEPAASATATAAVG